VCFGPASPDAGVELLRQLFLQWGLLDPNPEDRVDKASEDYFRQLGQDYSDDLPDSYSALEKGKL
jgi:hypothetical protein